MATINLPLTIVRPGVAISAKIGFTSVAGANDYLRIPRRYPFVDISNYADLKTAGYFRHATTTVSSEMGGSSVTNTEAKLGYQLPQTEKLILLVKKGAVGAESIVLEGSLVHKIPDRTISVPAGAVGDIYEIDLYDMGLFVNGVSGEDGVMIKSVTTTLGFALIARAA